MNNITNEKLEEIKKNFEENEIDTSVGAVSMLVTRKELNSICGTPWYSRVLYSVSDWLTNLALKIEDTGIWLEDRNNERKEKRYR